MGSSSCVAMYPSRKAMLKMITDPDYIESAQHRVAGLEGQLNIETSLDDNLLKKCLKKNE